MQLKQQIERKKYLNLIRKLFLKYTFFSPTPIVKCLNNIPPSSSDMPGESH